MKYIIYYVMGLLALFFIPQLILGAIFTFGIYYFLYSLFMGNAGGSNEISNEAQESRARQREKAVKQTIQNTNKTEAYTTKRHSSYSANGYSRYRNSNYKDSYDNYYDDCGENDMLPEDEIPFRGTGAPFL